MGAEFLFLKEKIKILMLLLQNFLRKPYYFYLYLNHNIQIFIKDLIYGITKKKLINISQNENQVYSSLKNKLSQRGIDWPFKETKKIHIVYASFPSEWESVNIPEQLSKISDNVSYYYTNNRGFKTKNLEKIRTKIDIDFFEWVYKLNNVNKIDVIVTYFSGAQISKKTIIKIKELGIPIFTFHLDDRLHFFGKLISFKWSGPYSVCKHYDLNLTNSIYSLIQYEKHSSLAMFWPEGANPDYFKPLDYKKDIDVLFVGAKYGKRESTIKYLIDNGVNIISYGNRWPNGKIDSKQMIQLISRSKVVLGFGYIGFSNYCCLKGRDFEIPSCGAAYLTTYNEELNLCFEIDKEIFTYRNNKECLDKIRLLLNNDELLKNTNNLARNKVINYHTWEKRFRKILFFN